MPLTGFTNVSSVQGEIIDSIEANVESSSIRVGEGVEQLRQAERYQVRYRYLSCYKLEMLSSSHFCFQHVDPSILCCMIFYFFVFSVLLI